MTGHMTGTQSNQRRTDQGQYCTAGGEGARGATRQTTDQHCQQGRHGKQGEEHRTQSM
ncbi:hypothetical protein [Neoroseomonas lacus]|nr:hypothetical protein [Neoroseomonas lacus]